MKQLVEIFNHLSLLPSLKLESSVYEHILKKKVEDLANDGNINPEIINNLKKAVSVIPKLRTLPPELSHLLYDIETMCLDIVQQLEKNGPQAEKVRIIREKIDRILYTYIAEDPKLYFKYCIVIKDIYNQLLAIIEKLKEYKMVGYNVEN